jgi:hypothetical protein
MKHVFVKPNECFGEVLEETETEVLVQLNQDPWFPFWVNKEDVEVMPY